MKFLVFITVITLYPVVLSAQTGWSAVTNCPAFYAQDAERLHIADYGDSSIIYSRSINGGVTWQTIDTIDLAPYLIQPPANPISPGGSSFSILNILFTDSLHGVITGNIEDARNGSQLIDPHALILTTSNAGRTWEAFSDGVTILNHLRVLPGGIAEVTAQSKASGGGWNLFGLIKVFANDSLDFSCHFSQYGSQQVTAVDFSDSSTAFCSLRYPWRGIAFISNDAGHSWTPIDSVLSDNAKTLHISIMQFGRDSILFGCDSTSNFRSTDLGLTWSKVDSRLPRNPKYLSFKANAVYASSKTGLYYSSDAGVTWDSVNSVSSELRDLQIANDSVAYTLISETLYKTRTHGVFSSVPLSSNHDRFRMYPNPANDYLVINRYDQPVTIFNPIGIAQYCPISISPDGLRLDIQNLLPGVYFVRLGNTISMFAVKH